MVTTALVSILTVGVWAPIAQTWPLWMVAAFVAFAAGLVVGLGCGFYLFIWAIGGDPQDPKVAQ